MDNQALPDTPRAQADARMGADPAPTVVVEDNARGVEAARTAAIRVRSPEEILTAGATVTAMPGGRVRFPSPAPQRGSGRRPARPSARHADACPCYGVMFWFTWNRLPGSYVLLTSTRRS
ncbi:hypothetical protein GCM10010253_25660 [Streptomyces badius]|uniref:Uncharacterized protein n=1 Tax=Streptomyces badius TaxID=1941 RepID=A0ABQ2T4Q8_STRBA|nr:hypothetical protein GCM10010253_25660 [Streptomyces badius]